MGMSHGRFCTNCMRNCSVHCYVLKGQKGIICTDKTNVVMKSFGSLVITAHFHFFYFRNNIIFDMVVVILLLPLRCHDQKSMEDFRYENPSKTDPLKKKLHKKLKTILALENARIEIEGIIQWIDWHFYFIVTIRSCYNVSPPFKRLLCRSCEGGNFSITI